MTPVAPQRMIALLRGVNVGGVTIKSKELGEVFITEGFTAVRTVLASGNVAFDAEHPEPDLTSMTQRIEGALGVRFGYEAKIVLLAQPQLADVVAAYPFTRSDQVDHPYVIFSSRAHALTQLHAEASVLARDGEALAVGTGVLYWRVPKGRSLDTPFAKMLAKSPDRQHLTTRNLRTVEKLTTA